jgi:hypothetical protein
VALSQKQQISVTPEMVLAGLDELAGFNPELDSAVETVSEIFRAMETKRRHSNPGASDLENSEGTARAIL